MTVYKALPGYFKAFQTENSEGIDSTVEDPIELVSHKSWKELYDSLPADTAEDSYKLIILARHGQGYHNAALQRYGLEDWENSWSLREGDQYGSWVDSRLTPLGKKQVQSTGEQILLPIVESLCLLPQVFFSSPMRRCLETFVGSWTPVFENYKHLASGETIPVNIIEDVRETLGEHTCDRRVSLTEVTEEYQDLNTASGHRVHWNFEQNYPEDDQMWLPDYRETDREMDQRIHKGLIKMFKQVRPDQKIISLTCHSGVIKCALRNFKHPPVMCLDTGKIVCAVVKINLEELAKQEHQIPLLQIN